MPPFSQQVAREIAFTPFGQHQAPAIVVTALYGCFFFAAIANWIITRFSWYDVVTISAALRTVGIAARAVFTTPGKFHPAYNGIFLAFSNAGYGASIASLLLGIFAWLGTVGTRFYSATETKIYRIFSLFCCFCIICFGPIIGVLAAGIEFGDYDSHTARQGEACRVVASYGLISVNFATVCLTLRLMFAVFITKSKNANRTAATATEAATQPKLIALFLVCALLLAIRGSTGVVAIYPSPYEEYWIYDYRFYSLDTLPELCALAICCWPALFARMGQAWPRATGSKDGDPEKQDGSKAAAEQPEANGASNLEGPAHSSSKDVQP
ncbi:hypothetical protein WJX73_005103 [Symbiochloris irregularis]|uniref:Uncharacterized protein n=1 Tax=Symbiochloris irregularis TaxID=706552 RepID=A0AAW1NQ65_9CHLO